MCEENGLTGMQACFILAGPDHQPGLGRDDEADLFFCRRRRRGWGKYDVRIGRSPSSSCIASYRDPAGFMEQERNGPRMS